MYSSTATSRMLVVAMAGIASILCGCTILAVPPAHPDVTELENGLSWKRALTYLEQARISLETGQNSVDNLNTVTLGGVGVGAGSASVATLAKAHPDAVLGSLTIAGISYAVNQTASPASQALVYKAGLARLACIRTTAYQSHQATEPIRAPLKALAPELHRATRQLALDMQKARTADKPDAALIALSKRGETALTAASQLQTAISRFLSDSDISFTLYTAVDATVREVNSQLRERAPSVAIIANVGSAISGFVAVHSKLVTAASDAKTASATAGAIASANHALLADQLVGDMAELQRVIDEIRLVLPTKPTVNTTSLDSCAMNLADPDVRTVTPAGPVAIKAGGDAYSLTVEQIDSRPILHDFDGLTPTAQNLSVAPTGDGKFGFAAPPGAAANTYTVYFYVKDGDTRKRLRPSVSVVVTQPTPGGATVNGTPTGGTVIVQTDTKKDTAADVAAMKEFVRRRALIGLGDAVKSEADPLWKGRVLKLNNCFGIAPADTAFGSALETALGKSSAVNAAGDCPGPKTAAAKPVVTPTPAPAPAPALAPASAAPGVAPVPKPPTLNASGAK